MPPAFVITPAAPLRAPRTTRRPPSAMCDTSPPSPPENAAASTAQESVAPAAPAAASTPKTGVCAGCGREGGVSAGCDGEGRVIGGLGAVLTWWPIKAYRPCGDFIAAKKTYRRAGQSLEEIAFGRKGLEDDRSISERLQGK